MLSQALVIADMAVNSSLLGDVFKGPDAALVVRSVALRNEGHRTITLEVGNWNNRCIDGKLLIVRTKAMTVGIWVREETGLKDWISRGLDVRNGVRR